MPSGLLLDHVARTGYFRLGGAAEHVAVEARLEHARAGRGDDATLTSSAAWLERYIAGDCSLVWDEMSALGIRVRSPDHVEDALTVARETMRRVRSNCALLIPRLESLGWRFGYNWAGAWAEEAIAAAPLPLGDVLPPPILDALENRHGVLPLALRAFYEEVGELNFVGAPFQRPGWPGIEDNLDPLYVGGAADAMQPGRVTLAPDFLGKYFISGVGPLYQKLPAYGADAPILFEGAELYAGKQRLSLVRYLRYAMAGGGFLAFMPGTMWPHRPEADLRFLTDGLLPI